MNFVVRVAVPVLPVYLPYFFAVGSRWAYSLELRFGFGHRCALLPHIVVVVGLLGKGVSVPGFSGGTLPSPVLSTVSASLCLNETLFSGFLPVSLRFSRMHSRGGPL